jgi:hypothetical protein
MGGRGNSDLLFGEDHNSQEPDAEVKVISCSFEEYEFHVIRVKFLGPIAHMRQVNEPTRFAS